MSQKETNVGQVERLLRIIAGVLLAGASVTLFLAGDLWWWAGLAAIALMGLGVDFIYTGFTGYCPLYHRLGWSTGDARRAGGLIAPGEALIDLHPNGPTSAGNVSPSRSSTTEGVTRMMLPVFGLSCGGGGSRLAERVVSKVPGVLDIYVNPATETAYVDFNPATATPEQIADAIRRAGYETSLPARGLGDTKGD